MSQETQLLVVRFLVPALLAAIGGWFLTRSKTGAASDPAVNPATTPPGNATFRCGGLLLGILFCSLGWLVSDYWAKGLLFAPATWTDWSARYQWNWLVWMLPAAFLALGGLRCAVPDRSSFIATLWPALILFAIASLYVSLVELEAWGDKIGLVLNLILLGLVAIMGNTVALNDLASSRANRWAGLVLMGQFFCVASVALQTYASLGELAIVGAAVCFGLTLATLTYKPRPDAFGDWSVSIVAFPLVSVAATILLLSGFFQSEPLLPDWLFYVVLFLPAIVWFFDFVYGRYGRVWWRVVLAAAVCLAVLIAILAITNPFANEW